MISSLASYVSWRSEEAARSNFLSLPPLPPRSTHFQQQKFSVKILYYGSIIGFFHCRITNFLGSNEWDKRNWWYLVSQTDINLNSLPNNIRYFRSNFDEYTKWILEANRSMDNFLDSLCLSWSSEGFCFGTAPFSICNIALHTCAACTIKSWLMWDILPKRGESCGIFYPDGERGQGAQLTCRARSPWIAISGGGIQPFSNNTLLRLNNILHELSTIRSLLSLFGQWTIDQMPQTNNLTEAKKFNRIQATLFTCQFLLEFNNK